MIVLPNEGLRDSIHIIIQVCIYPFWSGVENDHKYRYLFIAAT